MLGLAEGFLLDRAQPLVAGDQAGEVALLGEWGEHDSKAFDIVLVDAGLIGCVFGPLLDLAVDEGSLQLVKCKCGIKPGFIDSEAHHVGFEDHRFRHLGDAGGFAKVAAAVHSVDEEITGFKAVGGDLFGGLAQAFEGGEVDVSTILIA